MKRTYLSGHEKRKKKEDEADRLTKVLSQTPPVTTFFKKDKLDEQTGSTHSIVEYSASSSQFTQCAANEDRSKSRELKEVEVHDTEESQMDIEATSQVHINNGIVNPGLLSDIGAWPIPATDEMREYWTRKGNVIHKRDKLETMRADGFVKSSHSNSNRQCTVDMFYRKSANGERIERKWLCYSGTTGRLYCFECKLFNPASTALVDNGFNDWKHASERLIEHEKSKGHACAVLSYAQRADANGRVDLAMQKQVEEMTTYWVKLLQRLVSVIKLLSVRGLAFRGDNQILGSSHNGNYLGLLELIAEYDEFLAQHIQMHANKGTGHTNYLSSRICEELIAIMGQQVLDVLVDRVKAAKYYSVTVDSSEDNVHIDQLTVVLRYLEGPHPVERFFTFLESTGHKGVDMANALQLYLKDVEIEIVDCRGQSYDNASNMSGRYQGMQSRILQINQFATFIPCFGHSLNLVGKEAAAACSEAVSFFDMVQALYVFFTSSTARYKKLNDKLQENNTIICMPKKLSDTRWSCRAAAVRALIKGYNDIMDILLDISEDNEQKADCCSAARGLHDKMTRLETGIFAEFWNVMLERFNQSSKTLQSIELNLNVAAGVLTSLLDFVREQRDCFDHFEESGMRLSGTNEYAAKKKRIRRRNVRLDPLDYGHSNEAELTPKDAFRTKAFIPCIDSLVTCLETRHAAYKDVSDRFGVFIDLPSMNQESVMIAATKLSEFYQDDLDDNFSYELLHFQSSISAFFDQKEKNTSLGQFMYKLIIEKDIEATFPNTATALKIYLTLMITNCSGERSFSKMKLLKNVNRTTMGQKRFTNLARMSMESDILRDLDLSDVIHVFACEKARKVLL